MMGISVGGRSMAQWLGSAFAATGPASGVSSGGEFRGTIKPPSRRAAEPPSRRAAEPPSRRAAEPPSRRAAEPPSRRAAEPPSRRAAEPRFVRPRAGMSALAWLRRPGRPASRPEPSATTAGHLRRRLAAALLALPLFAAATAPTMAIAQTPPTATLSLVGASPLPEGAGLTFNVALVRALDPAETVTLPLVIGGTATRGTDYRIVCIDSSPAGAMPPAMIPMARSLRSPLTVRI